MTRSGQNRTGQRYLVSDEHVVAHHQVVERVAQRADSERRAEVVRVDCGELAVLDAMGAVIRVGHEPLVELLLREHLVAVKVHLHAAHDTAVALARAISTQHTYKVMNQCTSEFRHRIELDRLACECARVALYDHYSERCASRTL